MHTEEQYRREGAERIRTVDAGQRGGGRASPVSGSVSGGGTEPDHAAGSHGTAESGKVELLLQLQTLLRRLQSPEIRKEFCLGRIVAAENCEALLSAIDAVYSVLFPVWHSGDWPCGPDTVANASAHLNLLYCRSLEVFGLPGDDLLVEANSYATWMTTFQDIINANYWKPQIHLASAFTAHQAKRVGICQAATTNSVSYFRAPTPRVSPVKPLSFHLPADGGSLKSYCLRLQRMAGVNRPDIQSAEVQQLQTQVLAKAPESFRRAIQRRKSLRRLLNVGELLTWSQFLEEAEKQDKLRKGLCQELPATYRLPAPTLECHLDGRHENLSHNGRRSTRVFKNSQRVHKNAAALPHCTYCDRYGHEQQQCWRRQCGCLICGNPNHNYKRCPKHMASQEEGHARRRSNSGRPFLQDNLSDSDFSRNESQDGRPVETDWFNDSYDSLGVNSLSTFPAHYYHLSVEDTRAPLKTTKFCESSGRSSFNSGQSLFRPLSPVVLPDPKQSAALPEKRTCEMQREVRQAICAPALLRRSTPSGEYLAGLSEEEYKSAVESSEPHRRSAAGEPERSNGFQVEPSASNLGPAGNVEHHQKRKTRLRPVNKHENLQSTILEYRLQNKEKELGDDDSETDTGGGIRDKLKSSRVTYSKIKSVLSNGFSSFL